MTCRECSRPIRPQKTSVDDYPGTVVIGNKQKGLCWACARADRKAFTSAKVDLSEEPSVSVRVLLRPSVYRNFVRVANEHGTEPGVVLSMIADRSVGGGEG